MLSGQNTANTTSINPRGLGSYRRFYNLVLLSSSDSLLTSDPNQRE